MPVNSNLKPIIKDAQITLLPNQITPFFFIGNYIEIKSCLFDFILVVGDARLRMAQGDRLYLEYQDFKFENTLFNQNNLIQFIVGNGVRRETNKVEILGGIQKGGTRHEMLDLFAGHEPVEVFNHNPHRIYYKIIPRVLGRNTDSWMRVSVPGVDVFYDIFAYSGTSGWGGIEPGVFNSYFENKLTAHLPLSFSSNHVVSPAFATAFVVYDD